MRANNAYRLRLMKAAALEAVLKQMPAGVIIAEAPSGKTLLYNSQAESILGHSMLPATRVEEYERDNIFHTDGRPYKLEERPLVRTIRTGEVVTDEQVELRRADGIRCILTMSSVPLHDAKGKITHAVLMFQDITSVHRLQEDLKQAAEHERRAHARAEQRVVELDTVIDSLGSGLVIYDPQGNVVRMNGAGQRIMGYSPEDQDKSTADRAGQLIIETADGQPARMEDLPGIRALRGESVRDVIVAFRRPGQPRTWLSISAVPMYSSDGSMLGVVSNFSDVTALYELNQRLEQLIALEEKARAHAERRSAELETIIEGIADAVFVCDMEGKITTINRAGLALIGGERGDSLLNLTDYMQALQLRFLDGQSVKREELAISRALQGEVEPMRRELAVHPRTGRELVLAISAAPLRDNNSRVVGAVGVARDVTELTELDRLKDQFITVAAHELKTPVAVMKGHAQALRRKSGDLSEHRKTLEAIDQGADRMNKIVRDLIAVSQLNLGRMQLVMKELDLAALVEDVVTRISTLTIGHHISIIKSEPARVRGDRERLEQVLTNLITNSIKYSPRGGNIDVELVTRYKEVVVSVRDYGIGIPEDKQERLFQCFYGAHTGTPYDYGGMGVGLYVSREIVFRHNGKIWCESEEGKGSVFALSLPLLT